MSLNIGSRILIAAALIVIATFAAFILYFDFNQRSAIRTSLTSELEETGELATAGIANWIAGRRLLVENLGQNVALDPSPEAVTTNVGRPALANTFMFSYFGSADGTFTMHPDEELPADYDPRKRPWYQDAVAAGDSTLTEPYADASTGRLIVTVTSPVGSGSSLAGVVGGDIDITVLGDLVRSVDLAGRGYAFLVNGEGTILIHPDKEFTLQPMNKAYPENTPAVAEGLGGLDSGGDQMFAFFQVKGLPTVKWYLGMAIDRDAAFASLYDFRITAIVTAVVAVLAIMALLGLLVRNWVSRPVLGMTDAMTRLAEGDRSIDIPASSHEDEIASMAKAVTVFKENAIEMERLAIENQQAASLLETERRNTMNQMANSFETTVLSIVESVAQASDNTQRVARQLTTSAEESNNRALAVSNAASDTTRNVQAVAAATEQLSAAIGEIGQQVSQSISIARNAVEGVSRTSGTVTTLADSAQRIGEVVGLIQDVAGQTNLLALNATIEAARAGDAGKGFAVVASEVKSLANQTDRATGDIQTQVEGIQGSSSRSVDEINQITKTIEEINSFTGAIAAAVEEQGAATREISDSVARAAGGTQEVSSNVEAVSQASNMVSEEAKVLLESSNEMQTLAEKLRGEVHSFLEGVRQN